MSKISQPANIQGAKDVPTLVQVLSPLLQQIVDTVNGKIEYDLNLLSKTVSVKFGAANSDQAVVHGLGKVASHYIVLNKSAACDVYTGATGSTSSTIYLRSTVANTTVTLAVF